MSSMVKFSFLLSILEPEVRFIVGLLLDLAYPLAFIYRSFVSVQSTWIQNIFFSVSGIGLLYFVFGPSIWHIAVDIVTVYSLLFLLGGTKLSLFLTWIMTMNHVIIGYSFVSDIHSLNWTLPHSVLVLKLIGLAYNLYDGNKRESSLSNEERETCISVLPPLIEILGFCVFFGSVFVGPQINFKRYQQFVSRSLYDDKKVGSSTIPVMSSLSLALILTSISYLFNRYYPLKYISSEDYRGKPFITKLVIMIAMGKTTQWGRYIVVWLMAEGTCIITGISYNGIRSDGSTDWTAVQNVKFVLLEQSISFQGLNHSWNLQTNKWVAIYVYKRLKWIGNQELSHFIVLLFLTLRHGTWSGYFIYYSIQFITSVAERQFVSITKEWVNIKDLPWPIFIPVWTCLYLLKNIILMYGTICFMLLSWEDCNKFMSSVYWIGHMMLILWFALNLLLTYTCSNKINLFSNNN